MNVDQVDFAAVFAAQPTAYLVLSPELVVLAANEAYLRPLGRTGPELLRRPVFKAFPPAPGTLDEQGRNPLQVVRAGPRLGAGRPDAAVALRRRRPGHR